MGQNHRQGPTATHTRAWSHRLLGGDHPRIRQNRTGLLNRKTFDENLGKILQGLAPGESGLTRDATPPHRRRQHEDGGYWLAVLDEDHFKRVNDQFGHLYGDEVLLLPARIMQDSFRHQDRLFRFGGEEFVVILRATSDHEVSVALERLRAGVKAHTFPQVGTVTVSIGYTGIHSSDTIPDIVGRADDALYVAKDNGRNQVRNYEALLACGQVATREAPNSDIELF